MVAKAKQTNQRKKTVHAYQFVHRLIGRMVHNKKQSSLFHSFKSLSYEIFMLLIDIASTLSNISTTRKAVLTVFSFFI